MLDKYLLWQTCCMSWIFICYGIHMLQVPKDRADVYWDMAMRTENRFLETKTDLEALRTEFRELKRVDEARCANSVHQQSLVDKLVVENEGLKRRLKVHYWCRVVYGFFGIFVCCFILSSCSASWNVSVVLY